MENSCGHCHLAFSRLKPSISCDGFCQHSYHISCVGVVTEVLKVIKTPGLFWYCVECTERKKNYEEWYKTNFEERVNKLVTNVFDLFSEAQSKLMVKVEEKLESSVDCRVASGQSLSYANAVKNNIVNVLVKPKNAGQSNTETKLKIHQAVNPVDSSIRFSQVKHVKDGGLLIKCNSFTDAEKLMSLASQHLSDEYEVREIKRNNPRLKIVGISESMSLDELHSNLIAQNIVLKNSSECKVLKLWPTKKSPGVFQAIVDVDNTTYLKLLERGHVLVNFDSCKVYDAVDLKVCFKCCGLNHYAKFCKSDRQVCVKCSQPHMISECSEQVLKCNNCVNARYPDVHHAAWDSSKCKFYKDKLIEYKKILLGNE
ncbi:unnamed protein product [Acanthoscelides obtectus]|uniref:PHD-type domain-containing protein n=1 Tax=Acanthoscelides obtectus TaxID=200917 RepID=A0A9P0PSD1_ACAOB|nr:unnamed protein product [Acanthoscelides obtectus]CAK1674295.1 hypothetical protein AOBTE_LOCUS29583 [Acanthoscelides obtectus]